MHIEDVRKIIINVLEIPQNKITDEENLINYGLNSVTYVQILVDFESCLNADIPSDKLSMLPNPSISSIWELMNSLCIESKN